MFISSEAKKQAILIRRAFAAHRDISPCSGKHSLEECFTTMGNKLCFWFNTPDRTTHMLTTDL